MLKKSYEAFKVTIENKVAHIQMNRPEAMNTMNKAFWNELPEIVRTIDNNALGLSGSGEARSEGGCQAGGPGQAHTVMQVSLCMLTLGTTLKKSSHIATCWLSTMA